MNLIQQIELEAQISAHSIHPLDACGLIDSVLRGVEREYGLTERVRECALTRTPEFVRDAGKRHAALAQE